MHADTEEYKCVCMCMDAYTAFVSTAKEHWLCLPHTAVSQGQSAFPQYSLSLCWVFPEKLRGPEIYGTVPGRGLQDMAVNDKCSPVETTCFPLTGSPTKGALQCPPNILAQLTAVRLWPQVGPGLISSD